MSEKIANLIVIAIKVKGEKYVNVDFNGDTKGVTVFISDSTTHKVLERKVCYLDWDNAEERLNAMEKGLKELLNKAA